MNFTFKTEPMQHQLNGLNKYKDEEYFCFFWEQGTGKTKGAIDFCRYKYFKHKEMLKTLVIVKNNAVFNWRDEFNKHSNCGDAVQVLYGTLKEKKEQLKLLNKKIFILNYDSIINLTMELLVSNFKIIILDESQSIKNYKSKRSQTVVSLRSNTMYRGILSGTPMTNGSTDIFNQAFFLDGGKTFGYKFTKFRSEYFIDKNLTNKFARFPKWEPIKSLMPLLNEKIHKFADVKTKEECLDLPPKVYQTIKLKMTDEQFTVYKNMVKHSIHRFEDDAAIADTKAILNLRLNQISSGFFKLDESKEEIRFKENVKLNAVKEFLEDVTTNSKVVIWAAWRNNLELLTEELKCYNPALIYGGTGESHTQVTKFETDDTCRVLIANPQSACSSINLIQGSYAIYFSQMYNLEYRLQSEDRTHRHGSEIHKKITYIDLVYENSIDILVAEAIKMKKDIQEYMLNSELFKEVHNF